MFSCECLLAAALLTASPDGQLPAEALTWAEACRTELLVLCLDAELVDPRERTNFFVHAQDSTSDLKALQSRFRDFAFAPMAAECQRFPDRRAIGDFLAFNRGYRNDLLARLAVDTVHSETLRQAVAETDQLHHLWNTAREASCDYYYVTVRREALQLLRDLIGYEAFYRGEMPPYVPVWRFAVAR
jgi:hypothetical protein